MEARWRHVGMNVTPHVIERRKEEIKTQFQPQHTHKIANDFLVKMHVISSNEAKTHTQTPRVTA